MSAPRLVETRSARLLDSSGNETDASARKRRTGQFHTAANPFRHQAFRAWAKAAGLPARRILEPFAGSNRLIEFLEDMDICRDSRSFDIAPSARRVRRRDTLRSFPSGYEVCVTNPPWLARNSATCRGFPFPRCGYDDLYKWCLEKCLSRCPWVAALLPESFLRSGLFRTRLRDFISLTARMFQDTGHPVGLALFGPDWSADAVVWADAHRIGALSDLERLRPRPTAGAGALQRPLRECRAHRARRYADGVHPLLRCSGTRRLPGEEDRAPHHQDHGSGADPHRGVECVPGRVPGADARCAHDRLQGTPQGREVPAPSRPAVGPGASCTAREPPEYASPGSGGGHPLRPTAGASGSGARRG